MVVGLTRPSQGLFIRKETWSTYSICLSTLEYQLLDRRRLSLSTTKETSKIHGKQELSFPTLRASWNVKTPSTSTQTTIRSTFLDFTTITLTQLLAILCIPDWQQMTLRQTLLSWLGTPLTRRQLWEESSTKILLLSPFVMMSQLMWDFLVSLSLACRFYIASSLQLLDKHTISFSPQHMLECMQDLLWIKTNSTILSI